jgi:hypothetical protein
MAVLPMQAVLTASRVLASRPARVSLPHGASSRRRSIQSGTSGAIPNGYARRRP